MHTVHFYTGSSTGPYLHVYILFMIHTDPHSSTHPPIHHPTLLVSPSSSSPTRPLAVSDIRARGGSAHGYRVDITDDALVEAAARRVEAEVGAVDVLINNAGFVALS